MIVEAFRENENPYDIEDRKKNTVPRDAKFWYPTLLLNLDIKKALPEEGVEWLFVRVASKRIQNGRLDLEAVILDQEGEIVALSHHVCLVLGAERNFAERKSNKSKM